MSEFKSYIQSKITRMRPYIAGEDLTGVLLEKGDTPKVGGMIYMCDTDKCLCYMPEAFFCDNYESLRAESSLA